MDYARAQGTFVIGIDGGGTHTRVACVDLDGHYLSSASGGGGSPMHNDDAEVNVRATLARALEDADLDPAGAAGLVAGMAGFDRPSSPTEARYNRDVERFFEIDGMTCPRTVVNDAVIAHHGALSGHAGVIVVAGTGSMILAINERGDEIENGQFDHYAGAARHLVHDVVQRILTGESSPTDPLYSAAKAYFGVDDVHGLREVVLQRSSANRNDTKRSYGDFAPQVTALAEESPLADVALRDLVARTAQGVRLLAPLVDTDPVPVACTGSLASDPSFLRRLDQPLSSGTPRRMQLVSPRLHPLGGAALLALTLAGVDSNDTVLVALESALTGAAV